MLGWRWDDVIQRNVAAANTNRCLGTSCPVGLLATINDETKSLVAYFQCYIYPSCSSIVIEDWGNISGVQTTIFIRLLQGAPKLSDSLAGV